MIITMNLLKPTTPDRVRPARTSPSFSSGESEGVVTPEGYKIPTRYTHRQLATMIGSKRETVTKAFTLLQRAGVVELKRRRMHVGDIEALKKVANEGLHTLPVS